MIKTKERRIKKPEGMRATDHRVALQTSPDKSSMKPGTSGSSVSSQGASGDGRSAGNGADGAGSTDESSTNRRSPKDLCSNKVQVRFKEKLVEVNEFEVDRSSAGSIGSMNIEDEHDLSIGDRTDRAAGVSSGGNEELESTEDQDCAAENDESNIHEGESKEGEDNDVDHDDDENDDDHDDNDLNEEALRAKYFDIFESIHLVHGGGYMKLKTGVAGATPDKDSFHMFRGHQKKWVYLHWTLAKSLSPLSSQPDTTTTGTATMAATGAGPGAAEVHEGSGEGKESAMGSSKKSNPNDKDEAGNGANASAIGDKSKQSPEEREAYERLKQRQVDVEETGVWSIALYDKNPVKYFLQERRLQFARERAAHKGEGGEIVSGVDQQGAVETSAEDDSKSERSDTGEMRERERGREGGMERKASAFEGEREEALLDEQSETASANGDSGKSGDSPMSAIQVYVDVPENTSSNWRNSTRFSIGNEAVGAGKGEGIRLSEEAIARVGSKKAKSFSSKRASDLIMEKLRLGRGRSSASSKASSTLGSISATGLSTGGGVGGGVSGGRAAEEVSSGRVWRGKKLRKRPVPSRVVPLKDISEVYLDAAPTSKSFRIYLGMEVLHLTPTKPPTSLRSKPTTTAAVGATSTGAFSPGRPPLYQPKAADSMWPTASNWADAIFSSIQLQASEDVGLWAPHKRAFDALVEEEQRLQEELARPTQPVSTSTSSSLVSPHAGGVGETGAIGGAGGADEYPTYVPLLSSHVLVSSASESEHSIASANNRNNQQSEDEGTVHSTRSARDGRKGGEQDDARSVASSTDMSTASKSKSRSRAVLQKMKSVASLLRGKSGSKQRNQSGMHSGSESDAHSDKAGKIGKEGGSIGSNSVGAQPMNLAQSLLLQSVPPSPRSATSTNSHSLPPSPSSRPSSPSARPTAEQRAVYADRNVDIHVSRGGDRERDVGANINTIKSDLRSLSSLIQSIKSDVQSHTPTKPDPLAQKERKSSSTHAVEGGEECVSEVGEADGEGEGAAKKRQQQQQQRAALLAGQRALPGDAGRGDGRGAHDRSGTRKKKAPRVLRDDYAYPPPPLFIGDHVYSAAHGADRTGVGDGMGPPELQEEEEEEDDVAESLQLRDGRVTAFAGSTPAQSRYGVLNRLLQSPDRFHAEYAPPLEPTDHAYSRQNKMNSSRKVTQNPAFRDRRHTELSASLSPCSSSLRPHRSTMAALPGAARKSNGDLLPAERAARYFEQSPVLGTDPSHRKGDGGEEGEEREMMMRVFECLLHEQQEHPEYAQVSDALRPALEHASMFLRRNGAQYVGGVMQGLEDNSMQVLRAKSFDAALRVVGTEQGRGKDADIDKEGEKGQSPEVVSPIIERSRRHARIGTGLLSQRSPQPLPHPLPHPQQRGHNDDAGSVSTPTRVQFSGVDSFHSYASPPLASQQQPVASPVKGSASNSNNNSSNKEKSTAKEMGTLTPTAASEPTKFRLFSSRNRRINSDKQRTTPPPPSPIPDSHSSSHFGVATVTAVPGLSSAVREEKLLNFLRSPPSSPDKTHSPRRSSGFFGREIAPSPRPAVFLSSASSAGSGADGSRSIRHRVRPGGRSVAQNTRKRVSKKGGKNSIDEWDENGEAEAKHDAAAAVAGGAPSGTLTDGDKEQEEEQQQEEEENDSAPTAAGAEKVRGCRFQGPKSLLNTHGLKVNIARSSDSNIFPEDAHSQWTEAGNRGAGEREGEGGGISKGREGMDITGQSYLSSYNATRYEDAPAIIVPYAITPLAFADTGTGNSKSNRSSSTQEGRTSSPSLPTPTSSGSRSSASLIAQAQYRSQALPTQQQQQQDHQLSLSRSLSVSQSIPRPLSAAALPPPPVRSTVTPFAADPLCDPPPRESLLPSDVGDRPVQLSEAWRPQQVVAVSRHREGYQSESESDSKDSSVLSSSASAASSSAVSSAASNISGYLAEHLSIVVRLRAEPQLLPPPASLMGRSPAQPHSRLALLGKKDVSDGEQQRSVYYLATCMLVPAGDATPPGMKSTPMERNDRSRGGNRAGGEDKGREKGRAKGGAAGGGKNGFYLSVVLLGRDNEHMRNQRAAHRRRAAKISSSTSKSNPTSTEDTAARYHRRARGETEDEEGEEGENRDGDGEDGFEAGQAIMIPLSDIEAVEMDGNASSGLFRFSVRTSCAINYPTIHRSASVCASSASTPAGKLLERKALRSGGMGVSFAVSLLHQLLFPATIVGRLPSGKVSNLMQTQHRNRINAAYKHGSTRQQQQLKTVSGVVGARPSNRKSAGQGREGKLRGRDKDKIDEEEKGTKDGEREEIGEGAMLFVVMRAVTPANPSAWLQALEVCRRV